MDEQRVQAYLHLIARLLDCVNGEESQILKQNCELVDEDFLQITKQYAQRLNQQGHDLAANYLFNLTKQIEQTVNIAPRGKREQAYLQLIHELLQCSNGEEGQILASNQYLIDAGLIQTMQQVATGFDRQESSNGDWLRKIAEYLAQEVIPLQPSQAHFDLLLEIIDAISNGSSQQQVYYLLQRNLNKVDTNLSKALQIWASQALSSLTKQQQISVAGVISNFSKLIQEFPLGNFTINIAELPYTKILMPI